MTFEDLESIYASAPVSASSFEVISIEAPWFSKTYYLQNTYTDFIQVTLETGEVVDVDYCPMTLEQASSNADLNYERTLVFQQVNDIITSELYKFDPDIHQWKDLKVKSRGYIYYRNGDISGIKTPVVKLPVRNLEFNYIGVKAKVSSKPANDFATGEIATVNRVPMLRGFT